MLRRVRFGQAFRIARSGELVFRKSTLGFVRWAGVGSAELWHRLARFGGANHGSVWRSFALLGVVM
jgi:hypothetical protein